MDEFSDDGFDDLDDSILEQIENNALQFTQAQKLAQSQAAPTQQRPAYEYGVEDDDLDDTVVIDERDLPPPPRPGGVAGALPAQQPQRLGVGLGQQQWNRQFPRPAVPPQPLQQQRQAYAARQQFPPPRSQFPSRSQFTPALPSQRFHPTIPQRPGPQQSQFSRPTPPPVVRPYPPQPTQAAHGVHGAGPGQGNILAALQDKLAALETELTAAKGEAAILRSKYEKANASHDEEVARLKKQNAENAAKQERAIEAALAAERTATTELQFARQDLREGHGRAKSRRKDGSTTPKKTKSWGIADGFDGIEMTGSPSKPQAQKGKIAAPSVVAQGERTPSKGKRKRPAVDSPKFALETHSGDETRKSVPFPPLEAVPHRPAVGRNDLPLDFLKLALDHSIEHYQPLTFDFFSQFFLPSDPMRSFSTLIFEKLPKMGNAQDPCSLLVDFADLLIELWQQCLLERYHFPIFYIAALLCFTLQLHAEKVAPRIISSLIPVCTTTCRLAAMPRFNSVDGDISDHPDNLIRQLSVDCTIPQILLLLNLAADACLSPPIDDDDANPTKPTPQAQFWRAVDMEFVIIMLSTKQPERWWFPMLHLLSTSVLPTSLGPMPSPLSSSYGESNVASPELVADAIIDRVSLCLVEQPRWAPPGSAMELIVRLAVLDTLVLFAASPFCFRQIAQSDVALQRLVTVLCWAIDQLYDADPGSSIRGPEPEPLVRDDSRLNESFVTAKESEDSFGEDTFMELERQYEHDARVEAFEAMLEGLDIEDDDDDSRGPHTPALLCRVISQAVLLLHALLTDPRTADVVDMTRQLATSCGGSQRYLLTLARLSFAEEDLVLEAGIDAYTVERAHALLEMAVTPDEGEGMGELFGPDA
ncbi:hypothetical protein QBC34DRAFT_412294 [Podospora aff. communis PSN243]|uniref:DNA repair protein Rad26 n=1 Tax=Podospora aff. communis PSN243 TaxID=3040156 RepID=A0AAV9GC89_9PEZI|nr:hypothetical protein QBC34DRAFT_412294 [Podospora aff. communis PSN243]